MSRIQAIAALVPGTIAALVLAACGGGAATHSTAAASATTPSVTSASQTTTSTHTTSRRTTTTASTPTPSTTTSSSATSATATAPPSGGAVATQTATTTTATVAPSTTTANAPPTRTETAPAFVTGPAAPAGSALAAAIDVLERHGYRALSTTTYGPQDTLHVLVGAARDGSQPGERAFFFNEDTYLGTDASTASARIIVLAHGDSEVTLGYAIRPHSANAPSGVRAVRFGLDMGQLAALDALPSATARS